MPKLPPAAALRQFATATDAAGAARFFKTEPGEKPYRFLGVRSAPLRKLAKEYRELPLAEVRKLLRSEWHEERTLALLILGEKFPKAPPAERLKMFDFYLAHTRWINSWALVDCSAPNIMGTHLHGSRERGLLVKLARSKSLWERRIAIVATQYLIRQGELDDTIRIAKLLLLDEADLIHKAVGWMLREAGQKDEAVLLAFLDEHAAQMPRTMLRYSLERLTPGQRKKYMAAGRSVASPRARGYGTPPLRSARRLRASSTRLGSASRLTTSL